MVNGSKVKLCLGEYSEAVGSALQVEAKQKGPSRGRVKVELREECVDITLESDSPTGLIALLNSYLLLAHAAYSALRSVEPFQSGSG